MVRTHRLKTASRGSDLRRLGVHATKERSLVVRERVHRRERDVEPRVGVVDREHVDALPVVRQLPARAALGRVPSRDRGRAADVGEVWQRAKGAEALRDHPIRAVGARDGREAAGRVVVRQVVRDRHAERGGGERGKRDEERSRELHRGVQMGMRWAS